MRPSSCLLVTLSLFVSFAATAQDEIGTWENSYFDRDGVERSIAISFLPSGEFVFEHNLFDEPIVSRGNYSYTPATYELNLNTVEVLVGEGGWESISLFSLPSHSLTYAVFSTNSALIGYQANSQVFGLGNSVVMVPVAGRNDTIVGSWRAQTLLTIAGTESSPRFEVQIKETGVVEFSFSFSSEDGTSNYLWTGDSNRAEILDDSGETISKVVLFENLLAIYPIDGNYEPHLLRKSQ